MSNTEKVTDINEILETRNPAQFEADLLSDNEAAAIAQHAALKPGDRAAVFFNNVYPQFVDKLNGLNRKELIKVLLATIHYPLFDNINSMMPRTEGGMQTLGLSTRLVDAKLVMREQLAMEEAEALDKKEKEEYNNSTVVESTEGEK